MSSSNPSVEICFSVDPETGTVRVNTLSQTARSVLQRHLEERGLQVAGSDYISRSLLDATLEIFAQYVQTPADLSLQQRSALFQFVCLREMTKALIKTPLRMSDAWQAGSRFSASSFPHSAVTPVIVSITAIPTSSAIFRYGPNGNLTCQSKTDASFAACFGADTAVFDNMWRTATDLISPRVSHTTARDLHTCNSEETWEEYLEDILYDTLWEESRGLVERMQAELGGTRTIKFWVVSDQVGVPGTMPTDVPVAKVYIAML